MTAALAEREAFLQDWFTDSMIYSKFLEAEKKASYFGDAVFVLSWPTNATEPKIDVVDPASCFPFYDCNDESIIGVSGTVKDRIIIAWEKQLKPDDDFFVVHREVYELISNERGESRVFRRIDDFKFEGDGELTIEKFPDKMIINAGTIEDLGIDFIPIVWLPNIRVDETFGESNLKNLIHLFDAEMNTDTDLNNNSGRLGGASIVVSGKDMKPRRDSTGEPMSVTFENNHRLS